VPEPSLRGIASCSLPSTTTTSTTTSSSSSSCATTASGADCCVSPPGGGGDGGGAASTAAPDHASPACAICHLPLTDGRSTIRLNGSFVHAACAGLSGDYSPSGLEGDWIALAPDLTGDWLRALCSDFQQLCSPSLGGEALVGDLPATSGGDTAAPGSAEISTPTPSSFLPSSRSVLESGSGRIESHPVGGGDEGEPATAPGVTNPMPLVCTICSLPLAERDACCFNGALVHSECLGRPSHLPEDLVGQNLGYWIRLPSVSPGQEPRHGAVVAVATRGSAAGRVGPRYTLVQPASGGGLVPLPFEEARPAISGEFPGRPRLAVALGVAGPRRADGYPRGVWSHGQSAQRFADAVIRVNGEEFWFGSHPFTEQTEEEARAAAGAEYERFLELRRLAQGLVSESAHLNRPPGIRRSLSLPRGGAPRSCLAVVVLPGHKWVLHRSR